jgi:hypothetical protein
MKTKKPVRVPLCPVNLDSIRIAPPGSPTETTDEFYYFVENEVFPEIMRIFGMDDLFFNCRQVDGENACEVPGTPEYLQHQAMEAKALEFDDWLEHALRDRYGQALAALAKLRKATAAAVAA